MSKRLTTKRIHALIHAAGRGHDEMELADECTPEELKPILEGIDALQAILKKRTNKGGQK